jgi:hypothetical protein
LRRADDTRQFVIDDPRESFEHVNGAKKSNNQSLTPDLRRQEPGKVAGYFLSSLFAQFPPENRSLYDFDILKYFQIKQVFVSADDIVGSTLYSALKELIVAWIATDMNLFSTCTHRHLVCKESSVCSRMASVILSRRTISGSESTAAISANVSPDRSNS